jgi:hypothetical protein
MISIGIRDGLVLLDFAENVTGGELGLPGAPIRIVLERCSRNWTGPEALLVQFKRQSQSSRGFELIRVGSWFASPVGLTRPKMQNGPWFATSFPCHPSFP